MYRLQQLLRAKAPDSPEQDDAIRVLRNHIPAQVLGHFDRLIKQGRAGVALVRHGVCCECHLRVSVGTVASLVHPKDLHLCDHCGSYLLLPEDEVAAAAALLKPAPVVAPAPTKKTKPARV
jgi:predicted  nucleic acid-binding Zn-ribbon protein